jgi:hypothetical protein
MILHHALPCRGIVDKVYSALNHPVDIETVERHISSMQASMKSARLDTIFLLYSMSTVDSVATFLTPTRCVSTPPGVPNLFSAQPLQSDSGQNRIVWYVAPQHPPTLHINLNQLLGACASPEPKGTLTCTPSHSLGTDR